jgi:hypothetical protein
MFSSPSDSGIDPLPRVSRADRRAWRSAERRVRRDHEHDQLAALVGLAAGGSRVTGLTTPPEDILLTKLSTPVEMIIDGRRLRVGRVCRRSLARLREAVSGITFVPLTKVGRYGPYWVLTFRLATEQLVLLVEQLTLLPDWGGPGGRDLLPSGSSPLMGAGV